jgi:Na+-driven multidrug efflux pump
VNAPLSAAAGVEPQRGAMSPRTRLLLEGRIVPTLLRLAWPNVLVMLVQASTGLIETWFVSRLGTDALAGMALVFPGFMMMQMLSAGAVGGGISSAVARALGAGRRSAADALVWHAVIINAGLGLFFSVLVLAFGPSLYRVLGGEGASLEAAYGFFGLGLALYFASQGAGKLLWPLLGGFVRLIIAIGGGWLALRATGSSSWLFAALALGLIVYGVMLTAAVGSGVWFGQDQRTSALRFWRSGQRNTAEMSRP